LPAFTVLASGQESARRWEQIKNPILSASRIFWKTREYRSPCCLTTGTPVRTAPTWQRRRQEILGDWHAIMGPLAAAHRTSEIENYLQTESRENFHAHKIRIEMRRGQME